jgi:Nucleoside-diphosphate-sugar pyrophosphorylase involved in lipopolysaccharide biosynthesis/translation initiation factor 2B, gamma/epsilon subunits (eIF-2Bgamma/eIF-2Bepsilon)
LDSCYVPRSRADETDVSIVTRSVIDHERFKPRAGDGCGMSDNSVTAVILAAGEGRRLEPLTNRRPKPMVPVANRPLLEHVVEAVAAAGIDRIALVVGYRQERIRNHFGDGDDWGVTIEYVEQSTQLGTGHAVLQAESVVDRPLRRTQRRPDRRRRSRLTSP